MGFLTFYNKHIKTLNEAKELTPFESYDEYEQYALEKLFTEMEDTGRQYRNGLGYKGGQTEDDTMITYRDKGSNPVRLATSTTHFGKLMSRYLWCKTNWPAAVDAYKLRIYELIKETWPEKVFKYIQQKKDEDEKAKKFEEEVSVASTDKYAPKERDWEKMIDYMNKKSDPTRLADSCKDANKIVSRFCIAKALHWEAAAKEFKRRAHETYWDSKSCARKTYADVTDAELEAYARKYQNTNIPAKWQEYIDALRESDTKGGLAQQNSDVNHNIDTRIRKCLDNCIEVADYERVNYNKCKVVRYDKPDIWIYWYEGWAHNKRSGYKYRYSTAESYMIIEAYSDENYSNRLKTSQAYMAADLQNAIDTLMTNA